MLLCVFSNNVIILVLEEENTHTHVYIYTHIYAYTRIYMRPGAFAVCHNKS